ncbi:universal stress protein [Bacillus sp. EB600]|uniref:universal stress protein n=1 Tax=Bacillus sp. EB600 TaxID=2806345 RepID=UPI002108747E|nr:universal stress protein [Bacillus sp. EB600]MCQ6279369.1 universal stress protein [Bacillus sp. EB600]
MFCSKILVAFNDSDIAKKSLEKAVELAKTNSAIEIDVLFVAERPKAPYMVEEALDRLQESIYKYGETILAEAKDAVSTIDNPIRFIEEEGPAYKVILEHAKENNSDLIIMGSRGLSGVKEFLGSVSHYVIQHSPVPVLIIK